MKLITLKVVDSTNAHAHLLMDQGKDEEGMVILSLEQTAGKGQRGKAWESVSGMGLFASIILKPENTRADHQFFLNKAITLGVADYIEGKTGYKTKIKWPNDLMVKDAKIGGLLIENTLRGNMISGVIAGVGINLNNTNFPEVFETPASSFKMLTGHSFDPLIEIEDLFTHVWKYYRLFVNGELEMIDTDYHNKLYLLDTMSGFKQNDDVFYAKLHSVDNNGAAILEKDGKLLVVNHPDVRFYMTSKN
jgi:BirA family transcriptional regulator, biotin operon repressor / biotin---[acetyl-CoA-carboxylase] ligase